MADFSRFGAHLLQHFSRFDPKSRTLATRTPGWAGPFKAVPPLLPLLYFVLYPLWAKMKKVRRLPATGREMIQLETPGPRSGHTPRSSDIFQSNSESCSV